MKYICFNEFLLVNIQFVPFLSGSFIWATIIRENKRGFKFFYKEQHVTHD